MPVAYKIVSQKDEKARNSATGRKQRAIARAWNKSGGQMTTAQIAEVATKELNDADVIVSAAEVSNYVKGLKEQFPTAAAKLPTIKKGAKGKRSMAVASAGEMDDFLSHLNGEDEGEKDE